MGSKKYINNYIVKTNATEMKLDRMLNYLVDTKNNMVREKAREECSGMMFTLCSYISLYRKVGRAKAIQLLTSEEIGNTVQYINVVLNKFEGLDEMISNNEPRLYNLLIEYIGGYNGRYLKKKVDADLILVTAVTGGFSLEWDERLISSGPV